jgi:non-ribosomal peptide synthetase component F
LVAIIAAVAATIAKQAAATNDVLLAALAWALSRWTGRTTVSVDLEAHGREEILDGVDLSRTVGWFTSIFPVALDVSGNDEPNWRDLVKSGEGSFAVFPIMGLATDHCATWVPRTSVNGCPHTAMARRFHSIILGSGTHGRRKRAVVSTGQAMARSAGITILLMEAPIFWK